MSEVESRAPAAGSSAGARLRAAREAAGLSIDAVAQQLKLAPRQVTALEEDDWQRLPGRTFVRGFARNYARFVQLDPDAVLALLPAPEVAPALERPALRTSSRPMGEIPSERDAKPSAARWLVPVVVVVIVAALAYYELSRSPSLHLPAWLALHRPAATSPTAQESGSATTTLSNPAATPAPSSAAGSSTPATTATATQGNAGTLALTPKVLDSEGRAARGTEATPPGDAPPAPSSATSSSSPSPATGEAPSAATNATAPTQTPAAASGEAPLVLTFRATSWAEVKDANGRVVLQMTGGAGMMQTVTATPPLELALGNAPAVDVTFRGQALDLTPYTRGKVARVALK